MKIMLVGSLPYKSKEHTKCTEESDFQTFGKSLGATAIKYHHEIVVCSPFPNSVDYHAIVGANEQSMELGISGKIEIYHPETESVMTQLRHLMGQHCSNLNVTRFPCVPCGDDDSMTYSWLFAQLRALDHSAGIIALGGQPKGSSQLLFQLAVAKNKSVLPLPQFGGASSEYFDENYWDLNDALGKDVQKIEHQLPSLELISIFENLVAGVPNRDEHRFFISYPRSRPADADFVEALLLRRNCLVFRDEKDFEPAASTPQEIRRNISRANVFIAIWCREYACSPWCFDELEMALELKKSTPISVWIFCVDETRMVPKGARDLNYYTVSTRLELEGKLLDLLKRLEH